jgi:OTT_1508-like deaminase
MQQEILLEILRRCRGRLSKHIERFTNELKAAGCRPNGQFETPTFSIEGEKLESSQDIERLGIPCPENHSLYMEMCKDRLIEVRNLCSKLACSSDDSSLEHMVVLTRLTYDIRRSSSFKQFLQHNIQRTRRPAAITSILGHLIERAGKISRFYRAAITFTAVGTRLLKNNIAIEVRGVPTSKHQILELSARTPAQLRLRGGRRFNSYKQDQLQSMINRWLKYRVHSEMQLIVFYLEHPDLKLRSNYIGCDKLSCYLCHSFITAHRQFEVKGCHQALYSLWMVPDTIIFESEECANAFQNALRALCDDLEHKMAILRMSQNQSLMYPTNNESIANLSRISLPLSTSMREQSSAWQSTDNGMARGRENRCVEAATSQNNLSTIPEAPLLGHQQDNTGFEQAEQPEASMPEMEAQTKMEDTELGAMQSAPGLTDVISRSVSRHSSKSQREMLQPKSPSKHRRRHRHRHDGKDGHHIQRRRHGESIVAHQAPKHEHFGLSHRDETRHQTRRERHGHTSRRDGRHRRQTQDTSERQHRSRLTSSQKAPSEKDGFGCFWAVWTLLVRGCFGRWQSA